MLFMLFMLVKFSRKKQKKSKIGPDNLNYHTTRDFIKIFRTFFQLVYIAFVIYVLRRSRRHVAPQAMRSFPDLFS